MTGSAAPRGTRRRPSPLLPAGLASLVLFALLAVLARGGHTLALDLAISRAVQSAASPALDSFALGLTLAGAPGTVVALALSGAAALVALRQASGALALALTTLSVPLSNLLKALVTRPRPDGEMVRIVTSAGGESFPSGHAMGSLVFYACLYAVLRPSLRPEWRRAAAAATFLVVAGIGWTRVYLGVHWASDVIGGWLAGALLLACVLSLARRSGKESG